MLGPTADLASLLHWLAPVFDFLGSALGGMVVRVEGRDAVGQPARRAWHLAVDPDHGPEIPCMPAVLIARRLALGVSSPPGAITGMGLLDLGAFEPKFARWGPHSPIKNAQLAAALVILSMRTA